MIIVADIGNSFLKMARFDGRHLSNHVRVRHRDLLDSDWQAALDEGASLPSDGAFVASVADQGVDQMFEAWLLSRGHQRPRYLASTEAACGVRNAYAQPAKLGVDRWCALIGARAQHQGPLCVVDAGTALTVDWLDADGLHRGGMIMPGPNLQAESLFAGTRHVHESSDAPDKLFADNTSEAVASGVCNACAALIERACSEIAAASGGEVKVLITGGEADRIVPLLSVNADVQGDLVLQGVARLATQGES